MSDFYTARRTSNLYDPLAKRPFRLSRAKIDLFLTCHRCFYMDRKLGVAQPPGYPFSLNSAVDRLLKKEFDMHRVKKTTHPLMSHYGLKAIPFQDNRLEHWRDALRGGITYLDKKTNFFITGAIDDVWIDESGKLIIVDYKSTSKQGEVSLDAAWQDGYKRQMELYQWLFKKNGFDVSKTGYFVYCNGKTDREAFDAKLEFDIKLIPYDGDDSWVEPTINMIHKCLNSKTSPQSSTDCDFCRYRQAASEVEDSDRQESLF